MSAAQYEVLLPTGEDFKKILTAKLSYTAAKAKGEDFFISWLNKHTDLSPSVIAYNVSKVKFNNAQRAAAKAGKPEPIPNLDEALKYYIVSIAIDWPELTKAIRNVLKNWGYHTADIRYIADNVWLPNADKIAKICGEAEITELYEHLENKEMIVLNEAIEKHDTLNSKLFTKEEMLKDRVRNKMLEIVDEFLADLKDKDIKIKVDDILFIGSNASYNYTKDSDIDLHILVNTKATEYSEDIAEALYGAYRSLFNKKFDINLFDIPLEIYIETESTPCVSNGIYSVKKNKWVKKPVHEAIPDYDKDALDELVDKWEAKCKDLITDIKADKLDDEKRVLKLLADIYNKLRKKGISKGEYALENLAFKELRNKGYLDKLKDFKNELISKRLSLEEQLNQQTRLEIYRQITQAAGTQPIIQDNGMFYIYNVKASEINSKIHALRRLSCVSEVHANENGKYDFSNTLELAINRMPSKYYDIRGKINI